jgi:serine/threonine protein kinase
VVIIFVSLIFEIRDLKPENLLLESKKDDAPIKLIDFGCARVVEGNDRVLMDIAGTLNYIAPEILLSIPYGKEVDMWSVGVIFFALLSGRHAFNEQNDRATKEMIKKGHFTFQPSIHWINVSNAAKDLICRLLTLDMNQRLTVNQALDHEWIVASSAVLADKSLDGALPELKKFQAVKRWKKGFHAVKAVNLFRLLGSRKSTPVSSTSRNPFFSDDRNDTDNGKSTVPAIEPFSPVTSSTPQTEQTASPVKPAAERVLKNQYVLYENEIIRKENYNCVLIYKGLNLHNNETISIKKIRFDMLSQYDKKKYQNEVAILTDLSNDSSEFQNNSLLRFYDSYFDSTENSLYIMTELIDGSELFDRIYKKKYYNEKQARDLVLSLLTGIHCLHSQNIIHR